MATESGAVLCWGMLPVPPAGRDLGFGYSMHDWMPAYPLHRRYEISPPTTVPLAAGPLVSLGDAVCVPQGARLDCVGDYAHGAPAVVTVSLGAPDVLIEQSGFESCVRRQTSIVCTGRERRELVLTNASAVRAVARDAYELCALDTSGGLACTRWEDLPIPRRTLDLRTVPRWTGGHYAQIVSGGDVIVLRSPEGWAGWRTAVFPQDPHPVVTPGAFHVDHAREVSAGVGFGCALLDDGGVVCWGDGSSGQLGSGCCSDAVAPQRVATIDDGVHIASGSRHTCVERSDHSLWCWGDPSLGRLGTGAALPQARPRWVALDEPVIGAVAGWAHTCALTASHRVYCWGRGYDGQLGDRRLGTPREETDLIAVERSRARPTLVLEDPRLRRLSAAEAPTCASGEGVVWCWGDNPFSMIGGRSLAVRDDDGNVLAQRDAVYFEPVRVSLERFASMIPAQTAPPGFAPPEFVGAAAGEHFACGWTREGRVRCAGQNEYGQLGDGTYEARTQAVEVVGVEHVVGVAVGAAHACAWTREGRLACWGNNDHSQLSEPESLDPSVPHPVRLSADGASRLATRGAPN